MTASNAVESIKPVASRAVNGAGRISRPLLVKLGLIEDRKSFFRRPSFYIGAAIATISATIIKELFSPSNGN
ncbi:hypothetical protein KW792_02270 [Candidatus Saccharibacteria bacterium]|nr:hypothetical protein [Candidatus Saccharibacteria bacterium]